MTRGLGTTKPRMLILGFRRFSELVYSVVGKYTQQIDLSFHDLGASSKTDFDALIDRYHPDVIMSAGANAAYLADTLAVPVVSQPVRDADVIEACLKAKQVSSKVHLFTYAEPTGVQARLIAQLGDLLGITVIHKFYRTSDEASEVFYLSLAEKPEVVVGPSYTCHMAEKEGIPSILLYSRESAEDMIQNAMAVAQRSLLQARHSYLRDHLFEQTEDLLFLLDPEKNILELNPKAQQALGDARRLNSRLRQSWHLNDIQNVHTERWVALANERYLQIVDVLEHNDHLLGYLVRYRPAQAMAAVKAPSIKAANFVVSSPRMSKVASLAKTYAVAHGAVLIVGESGTGKEHIAREIHRHSRHANGPLVAVNCGSLPSELFESEMFGYEEGAFTNSRRGGHRGLLEQANKGVLFLDEVAEMPLAQQSKLLRILQDKVLRPVGSERSIQLDLKVVAATNRPLFQDVEEGRFREDLYYRLNTFALEIPPLRERKEDISAIAAYYLEVFAQQYGLRASSDEIYVDLSAHFERYRWPGNVRELESFCERVVVALMVEPSGQVTDALLRASLPELFREGAGFTAPGALKKNELQAIESAMQMYDGDRQAVAEHLGISTTTLWRRLKTLEQGR